MVYLKVLLPPNFSIEDLANLYCGVTTLGGPVQMPGALGASGMPTGTR